MQTQPYLFFDGRCEEAIGFYQKAVGAEVRMMMRFKESPDPAACPAGAGEKVMHACLRIGDTEVFASDGHNTGKPTFAGFSLALTVDTEPEADRVFAALSKGGEVRLPLTKTFFSPKFGMAADRFGVGWMIMVKP